MGDARKSQLATAATTELRASAASLQSALQQANAKLSSAGLPTVDVGNLAASVTTAGSTDTVLGVPVAVVAVGVAALGLLVVGAVILMRRKG